MQVGGSDPEEDNMLHAEIYTAYLSIQTARIYLNIGDSQLLQTIPLTDFKNILMMWKEFLIQNSL